MTLVYCLGHGPYETDAGAKKLCVMNPPGRFFRCAFWDDYDIYRWTGIWNSLADAF